MEASDQPVEVWADSPSKTESRSHPVEKGEAGPEQRVEPLPMQGSIGLSGGGKDSRIREDIVGRR